ncbi:ParB/Srx family N-terminal domain-containing protein [Elusimicrobiota bacterium]
MEEKMSSADFEDFIRQAYSVSADIGQEVERVLREGWKNPLSQEEIRSLLTQTIKLLRESASSRKDKAVAASLKGDIEKLVARVLTTRAKLETKAKPQKPLPPTGGVPHSQLTQEAEEVYPRPCFRGRSVPMLKLDIPVRDIELWDNNYRLETHLAQFEDKNGRKPSPLELLDIMLSKMDLPGIPDDKRIDQFEIIALAHSIAENGVRKPPIVDVDMTLLDGNRRVAACRYILGSDEFTSAQKSRAEATHCWQLTPYANDRDREAIIVSLNFEDDCKEPWPEYVKARMVYERWQSMLALEDNLTPAREKALLKELRKIFADDASKTTKYLTMMGFVQEFEEYQINEVGHDTYEAKHRADRYFQYFDELTKGKSPGGVYHTLGQRETLKKLVFDLLYQGKFKNWRLIRSLKYSDEDTVSELARALEETDLRIAKDLVEDALHGAHARAKETREVGANTRIKSFTEWLEALPPSAFRDKVTAENLQKLLDALELVKPIVREQLGEPE